LIVDVRLGGLIDGLLNSDQDKLPPAADSDKEWSRETGVRVRRASTLAAAADGADWRFEDNFAAQKTEDGEVTEWLIVEHLKASSSSENGKAISNPQSFAAHQSCIVAKARTISEALELEEDLARALEIAARLHDEGKKAPRWQRAFNARRDDVYAKTKG